jgi:hypothetical protein
LLEACQALAALVSVDPAALVSVDPAALVSVDPAALVSVVLVAAHPA